MHARGLEQGYSSHAPGFGGIGEDEAAESDTSSEEDYRRAFVDAHVQVPVPAPHQIGEEAGSKDAFMPSVNYPTKNSSKHSSMRGVPATNGTSAPHAPPPPPPRKDTNPSVPMPAVPTAPRLDVNQVNMSGVPTAPKLYMPGQQNNDDSSSDEGPGPATVAHRNPSNRFSMSRGKPTATQSEASRPVRPNMHRRTKSGSSDDDPGKLKRNSSFFGKVGKLFKSDLRDAPMPSRAPPSGWQTRTDARLRESSPAKNKRASYRRNEPDSSDEEPDERELVRHVNNPKALWERNTASDVGSPGGGKLVQKPRTAVSRITAGPLSTKAKEAEEERQRVARLSVIGSGIGQGTPSAGNNAESQSVKKTKKSKKHGSEIGTAPTRTAADAFPTSVVVPGDASAGVRRTDSLKPGLQRSSTMRPTASGKKQRASMMSTSGSLNAFSPQESKYATANWVAKAPTGDADEVGRPAQQMTAADIARNAGVVPKPAGQPTSAQAASHVAAVAPPRGAPAGIQHSPSATKSPLLKPALKFPGVNTAGSISSIGSGSQASPSKRAAAPVPEPVLAPVPTALPPISASVLASAPAPTAAAAQATTSPVRVPATQSEQSKAAGPPKLPQQPEFEPISAPKSVLSFDEETPFDGTGALDLSLDSNTTEEAPVAAPRSPATAPRLSLQLTAQEPWNLSLGQLPPHQLKEGQSPTTPALMTPGAADAYTSFLNSTPEEQRQAEGVTRTTERTAKLTPSRRYGPPATIQELTDTSEEENSSVEQAKRANDASDDREIAAARQAVENQTQAAFADSASDAQLRDLRLGDAPATSLPAALSVPVGAGPDSESNSALSRRKSVRMAPDTKLPPETPTREEDSGGAPTPRADAHGGRDPMALSSRIAPPPPAPPRLPDKDKAGPTQLTGASALEGRSSGWSTRIGQGDDSSDEEVDDYSVARQAFGSASRSWGRATGQIKPKKKVCSHAIHPSLPGYCTFTD